MIENKNDFDKRIRNEKPILAGNICHAKSYHHHKCWCSKSLPKDEHKSYEFYKKLPMAAGGIPCFDSYVRLRVRRVVVILSVISVTCLVITTELQRTITQDTMEMMTSSVLYGLLGMGVILNFLLLVGGYQKDISALRLYNYYAVAIVLTAVMPIIILIFKKMFIEVFFGLFAMAMQCYVIMLVRSEVVKLEENQLKTADEEHAAVEEQVDVSECITLV